MCRENGEPQRLWPQEKDIVPIASNTYELSKVRLRIALKTFER